jgi:hypothetical protein
MFFKLGRVFTLTAVRAIAPTSCLPYWLALPDSAFDYPFMAMEGHSGNTCSSARQALVEGYIDRGICLWLSLNTNLIQYLRDGQVRPCIAHRGIINMLPLHVPTA